MIGSKASVKKYSVKQRISLNIRLSESGYYIRDKLFSKSNIYKIIKYIAITVISATLGFAIFVNIPLRYVEPDFVNALKISRQTKMYAYDAYFLDCAIRHKAPLLTLDRRLLTAAKTINVATMEV